MSRSAQPGSNDSAAPELLFIPSKEQLRQGSRTDAKKSIGVNLKFLPVDVNAVAMSELRAGEPQFTSSRRNCD